MTDEAKVVPQPENQTAQPAPELTAEQIAANEKAAQQFESVKTALKDKIKALYHEFMNKIMVLPGEGNAKMRGVGYMNDGILWFNESINSLLPPKTETTTTETPNDAPVNGAPVNDEQQACEVKNDPVAQSPAA